jgi:protein-tyrosine phosphatase
MTASDGYAHAFADDGRIRGRWTPNSESGVFPTWNLVADNLYLGGQPVHGLPEDVTAVVDCDQVRFYEEPKGAVFLHLHFEDCETIPQPALLEAAARLVNRLRTSGPVYLHCRFGLNRSALIAARCLILAGAEPAAAIAQLRERRDPRVLCNEDFAGYLLTLQPGK